MPMKQPTHEQLMRARAGAQPKREDRPTAQDRGYDGRWQKARATYLAQHPLCRECQRSGMTTVAELVDHITPHRGDRDLFWDHDNWQALCRPCHDRKTAKERKLGSWHA